jgi:hypothetical protein
MADLAHPSNPLALAVLALLFERPMHPYEMAATLKQRHKGESIKIRYGSLYTVVELLVTRGWITARETSRAGKRPELMRSPHRDMTSCMRGCRICCAIRSGNIRNSPQGYRVHISPTGSP